MKKFLIIGIILIVIGAGVFTSALAICDFDITKISTEPAYTDKEYVFENKNQDIFISGDYANNTELLAGKSSDDKIHFTCYENSKNSYKIEDSDNLKIDQEYRQSWYDILSLNFEQKQCKILLPESYNANISINRAGNITVDSVIVNNLIVTEKVGRVTVNNLKANTINIESYTGKVQLDNVSVDSLNITEQTGKVTVSNLTAKTANIKSYTGEVRTENITADSLNIAERTGKVTVNNLKSNTLKVEGNTGQIQVNNIDSNDISLSTEYGNIRGRIKGNANEYSITSITKHGKSNLTDKQVEGGKNLYTKTQTGSINIDFN